MRDNLIELIQNAVGGCARHWAELIADALIANGVTFADGNNVGGKHMTNGDRIRSMSDEGLAEFIVGNADDEYVSNEYGFELVNWRYFPVDYEHRRETAQENVLYWLKQPVEEFNDTD
jgi:hypothetical protein